MNMKMNLFVLASLAGGLLCVNAHSAGTADSESGIPGVATQRAVVNFAELARQAAPPAAAPLNIGPAAPAGFAPASMGGTPPSPAPASSFQALEDDGGTEWPPDTIGAVGPNHLMLAHNVRVRIQDRSGAVLSTIHFTNFWAAVGPFNLSKLGYLSDPRFLYDPYGERWMIFGLADTFTTNSAALVGVSQTDDPTGNWNLYRVRVDSAGRETIDYPCVGFSKDWIVVQFGHYALTAGSFGTLFGSRVYVFNKTNLYAHGAGLFTKFDVPNIGYVQIPATSYDDQLATMYLLGTLGVGAGGTQNSLRLYTVTGPVGAEVFTSGPLITVTNAWDETAPGGFNAEFLPQLGGVRGFRALDSEVQGLVYRNGSLWASHFVFLPPGGSATRAAVQWWQLSPQGAVLQRGLIDDPTGTNHHAFPSLSVNRFNDVLIGYNRFSRTQYVSANYAFRAANDPPNTLRRDTVLKAGEAPYVRPDPFNHNRWGDFSASVVDPLNDTDLWTIQEYAGTPVTNQSRWGTWWGRIVPPNLNLGITDATVTEGDSGSSNALFNVTLSKANDQTITVDFATVDGSATAGQDYTATNGTLIFNPRETNKTITVSILGDVLDETNETFFVTLSNPTNIVLAYTQAQGTIVDNDPVSAAISINDITVREGDAGLTDATFMLSLSAPSGLPIIVRAGTANGNATLRVDYVPTNIVVTIPPGATSQPVTIKIIGDTLIESNETFFVNLSSSVNATITDSQGKCTILDDDFKVTALELTGGDVRLSFTTQRNQTYRVERTDDLSGTIVWATVPGAGNVSGTGAIVHVMESGAANRLQRFYRVRIN